MVSWYVTYEVEVDCERAVGGEGRGIKITAVQVLQVTRVEDEVLRYLCEYFRHLDTHVMAQVLGYQDTLMDRPSKLEWPGTSAGHAYWLRVAENESRAPKENKWGV